MDAIQLLAAIYLVVGVFHIGRIYSGISEQDSKFGLLLIVLFLLLFWPLIYVKEI
jgi:hypothetical protein